MRKRVALLVVLIAVSFMTLAAISVEELYQHALEQSTTIAELSTSRYNSFVDTVLSSLKGPSWTIGVQGAEYKFADDSQNYYYQLPSLEISYASPETDRNLSFDARAGVGSIKFEEENDFKAGSFDISFHGGVRKAYEFKSWDSNDYSKGWSEALNSISYENAILQYENEFLNDIRELLLLEREYIGPLMGVSAVAARYYSALRNGEFSEDSPEAIKLETEIKLKTAEMGQVVESYKERLKALSEKYNVTIEELMVIDGAEKYELSLTPMEEGNYEVHSKYLDMVSIQQQIDEKLGTSSTLTLRAGLDPRIGFKEKLVHSTNGIGGEVGASYSTGNLSLDLSLTTEYSFDIETQTPSWTGPTITIGGTWSNTPQVLSNDEIAKLKALYTSGTTFNRDAYEAVLRDLSNNALKRNILEMEKMEASLNEAIREWNNALASYRNRCNELLQEIRRFNNEYELFLIRYEGEQKLTERMKELYNEGKILEDDFLEADTARTQSERELLALNITSHILYNEIKMLQK